MAVEKGDVIKQGSSKYHVTRVTKAGGVFGHSIRHCDDAGCAGNELYLGELVTVDEEYGPEAFWDAVDARRLRSVVNSGIVTAKQRKVLESLPGFADGPEHANTALIFGGQS